MRRGRKSITVPCHVRSLDTIRTLIRESLQDLGLPDERKDLICRAVEEAVESYARYSAQTGLDHDISLSVESDGSRFRAVLTDEQDDPGRPVEKPGRLGMTLARQIMDEISYTFLKGSRSELELVHSL